MNTFAKRDGGLYRGLAIGGALLATSFGAFAQTASPEELDQRIRILERKLELQSEEAAAKAKDAASVSIGEKGLSVKKGDSEFKFNALIQLDGRWFIDDDNNAVRNAETFTFRRIRPTFQGSVGKLIGYRLTPEFAGGNASIVDAYLDLNFSPAATIRAGKVKGPVGLERLQGGGAIAFIERGLPTELAPNREIGVQLQGAVLDKTLSYVIGVYNGTRDGEDGGATDNNGRKEVAARVFYEPVQGLGFGVGASHGSKKGVTEAPRNYATVDRRTGISYAAGTSYDGDATRISPQGYFYTGGFGLLAEYIVSKQELTNAGVTDKISNDAWQLVAGYVLTGEDASFRGVTKVASPFKLGEPGWGAFEVVARVGELNVDEDGVAAGFFSATGVETIKNAGVGLNWYLNNNLKLAVNYNQTSFSNFSGPDREDDKSIFTRLQLQF